MSPLVAREAPDAGGATEPSSAAMSDAQRALWFLHQLDAGSTAYHLARAARIRPRADARALEAAFRALSFRHAALRTTFRHGSDGPLPVVHELPLAAIDVRAVAGLGEEDLRQAVADDAAIAFDLAAGPLIRATLFAGAASGDVLAVVIHHIVCDYLSLFALLRDLGELYAASLAGLALDERGALAVPPASEIDALPLERQRELWAHWERRFARSVPSLVLAADRPRSTRRHGGSQRFRVARPLADAVTALAHSLSTTTFTLLLATYALFLARHTGATQVVIGVPAQRRRTPAQRLAVGYFVATLPVLIDTAAPSFRALVRHVHERLQEALSHAELPLSRLLERLRPSAHDAARAPLVETVFTLLASRGGEDLAPFALGCAGSPKSFGGLTLEPLDAADVAPKFDIALVLAAMEAGLVGAIEYDTDMFDAPHVAELARRFVELLARSLASPDGALPGIEGQAAPARQLDGAPPELPNPPALPNGSTRPALNESDVTTTAARDVVERVWQRARCAGDGQALVTQGGVWSARAVGGEVERGAAHLQALGVTQGTRVAVAAREDGASVLSSLAVLAVGGVLVPLASGEPPARLAAIVRAASVHLIVCEESLFAELPPDVPHVSHGALTSTAREARFAPEAFDEKSVAVLCFQAGDVDSPSAVAITRGALAGGVVALAAAVGESSEMWLTSTLPVAAALTAALLPLVTSGCLVPLRAGWPLPAGMEDDSRRALLALGPSSLRMLRHLGPGAPVSVPSSRELCFCEAPTADLLAELRALAPRAELVYGPPEAAGAAALVVDGGAGVALLKPFSGITLGAADASGGPTLPGVAGPFCLGVAEPSAGGHRWLAPLHARARRDGRIELLAATALLTPATELQSLESALVAHPAVRAAAAAWRLDASGARRLVAYVVLAAPTASDALRAHVSKRVSEELVPALVIALDELPVSPWDTLDRAALPDPAWEGAPRDHVAPRSGLERAVASICEGVLGVAGIGAEDDLFALGAHSLLATRITARLSEAMGVDLPVRAFFERPSVAGIAAALSALEPRAAVLGPRPRPRSETVAPEPKPSTAAVAGAAAPLCGPAAARVLAALDELSDAETDVLLARLLRENQQKQSAG